MRNRIKPLLPLFGILAASYLIRIIKPNVFISEIDYPGHIVATMRLFLTTLLEFKKLSANFFIQLVSFRHGFTTMLLPYLLYNLFFAFFKISVTEIHLVMVNSILGLASITSFYIFVHVLYGKKSAVISTLLYSALPLHIGLSRVHVGNQIIQSIFFPLSLCFLYYYMVHRRKVCLFLYYIATFFYIGSDNAFVLGILIHVLFVAFFHRKSMTGYRTTSQIYLHIYNILFILLPIIAYLVIDLVRIGRYGILAPGGFLLRAIDKIANISFTPMKPVQWSLELFGPIFIILVIIVVVHYMQRKFEIKEKFFLIWISIYIIVLSASSSIERSYIFYISIPTCVLLGYYLRKKVIYVVLSLFITLIYSFSILYSVPFKISSVVIYGSVDHDIKNNDYGVKTLGYLVRKQMLPIRVTDIGNKIKKLNIYMDVQGGWYYTGEYYFDRPTVDLSEDLSNVILVYRPHIQNPGNRAILELINKKHLSKIGAILNKDKILLELYSDEVKPFQKYDTGIYNKLFDTNYGNIQSITKLRLGIY